jgi:capsular exopolysaccharide synthesis family protein
MALSEGNPMELAELIGLLRRRQAVLLRCLLIVPLVAWLVMAMLPVEYAATAMIGVGRPAWQAPDLASRGNDSGRGDVHTQETLLTTPSLLEAVIERLQLTTGDLDQANRQGLGHKLWRRWRPLGDAQALLPVKELQGRITVKNLLNTSLVGVTVTWPDARTAQRLANAIAESYSQRNQLEDAREATTTRRYLESQAAKEGAALADAEAGLATLRRRAGPLLAGDSAAVSNRVDDLAAQAREAQAALAESRARAASLAAALASRDRQMAHSLDPGQSRERDAYYASLRTQLSEARAQAHSLAAKTGTLGAALGREQALLTRLPEMERQLQAKIREATLHKEAYANLQTQLTQVRLAEAAKIGTARLVEPAELPAHPAKPKKAQNLALAIIAGLLLGVLWGTWQEFNDPAFRSADDVTQQLDLPLLGSVPELPTIRPVKPTDGIPLLPPGNKAVARWQDPEDATAEAFRLLRVSLRHLKPPTTVVVVSPGVGEGKTTVSVNLAIGLAQIGRRVLLIDSDLRRPAVHRQLHLPGTPGLSDLLQAEIGDAQRFREMITACTSPVPGMPGLDIIPGGSRAQQPGDLLESPRLAHLITLAREAYDVVILDGPPALAYADALPLGSLADGVVLVVDPRRTPRRAAHQVVTSLKQARIPILGIVANRTDAGEKPGYGRYETGSGIHPGPAEVS